MGKLCPSSLEVEQDLQKVEQVLSAEVKRGAENH